ncbi:MAG: MFS transporter [Moraxella sp.]|nr:MFS transporter [Moraxella sp.]
MLKNFFATPNISCYTLFTLLFQMGMAVSLAAMPIYFKQEDAISAYGMAYSVMAITGAFSFIYGVFIDRIGFAKALMFGVLLYAIALSMRIFTHPMMAVMTAIMAGIGASVAILANRSWILQISQSSTHNTTKITAMRSVLMNTSTLVGTALVSLAVFVFGSVYFWLLLSAGALVMISAVFARQNLSQDNNIRLVQKPNQPKRTFRQTLTVFVGLFVLANFVMGVYVGLFKPYLILMFIDYGVSESKSVFIFLLTTFMTIVVNALLLKYHRSVKNIPFIGYFLAMAGYVACFVVMAAGLFYGLGLWVLVLAVLARSAFSGLAVSFEEVLEYELFDKASLATALGLTQTAFLAGDAVGSLITSLWVVPKNSRDYAQICLYCAILAVVHMGVFVCLKVLSARRQHE